LKTNTSLTFLDLRNNSIGPESAPVIGYMLQENRALKHVDLSWNDIGPGGKSLLLGFEANPVIVQFGLNGTRISEETLYGVDLILRRNRSRMPSTLGSPVRTVSPLPKSTVMPESPGPVGNCDLFSLPSQGRPVNDDGSALKMLQEDRTYTSIEDVRLLADSAERIRALQLDIEHHKQHCGNIEENERISKKAFMDRELRYSQEVREYEQMTSKVNMDKDRLLAQTQQLQSEVERKQNDKLHTEHETIQIADAARIIAEHLRSDLHDCLQANRDLEAQIVCAKTCLAQQEEENTRLRKHINTAAQALH